MGQVQVMLPNSNDEYQYFRRRKDGACAMGSDGHAAAATRGRQGVGGGHAHGRRASAHHRERLPGGQRPHVAVQAALRAPAPGPPAAGADAGAAGPLRHVRRLAGGQRAARRPLGRPLHAQRGLQHHVRARRGGPGTLRRRLRPGEGAALARDARQHPLPVRAGQGLCGVRGRENGRGEVPQRAGVCLRHGCDGGGGRLRRRDGGHQLRRSFLRHRGRAALRSGRERVPDQRSGGRRHGRHQSRQIAGEAAPPAERRPGLPVRHHPHRRQRGVFLGRHRQRLRVRRSAGGPQPDGIRRDGASGPPVPQRSDPVEAVQDVPERGHGIGVHRQSRRGDHVRRLQGGGGRSGRRSFLHGSVLFGAGDGGPAERRLCAQVSLSLAALSSSRL